MEQQVAGFGSTEFGGQETPSAHSVQTTAQGRSEVVKVDTGGLFSAEILFLLFGMVMTLGGLVGGKRVKLVSIEFGPIASPWRRAVMVVIGLTIMACIGLMEMNK